MTTRYIREFVLRARYVLSSTTITFFCSYFYSEQIIYILTMPLNFFLRQESDFLGLQDYRLISTELTEVFYTYILSSTFITLWTFFPMILYQLWQFIKPGLYLYEKYLFFYLFTLFSSLSIISLLVAHLFIIPIALNFFLSYQISSIPHALDAKIYNYSYFIFKLLFLCNILFQFPVILSIIETKRKRYIIYPFAALATTFTPDIISQILILVVVVLLYEFAVCVVKFAKRLAHLRQGRSATGAIELNNASGGSKKYI